MSAKRKAGDRETMLVQKARLSAPRLLLFVSLMLNFLAFIVVLRRPGALSGIFSQGIAFENNWYSGISVDLAPPNTKDSIEQCAPLRGLPASAVDTQVPVPINPWKSLALEELSEIKSWLEAPARELNLTSNIGTSKTSDNFIFLIEAYPPTKASAIAYFADPVVVSLPERRARVTVHHGGLTVPVVRDYLVGPLPIRSETRIRVLDEIYHREDGDIPFNARGVSHLDEMSVVLAKLNEPITHIMQVCFFRYMRV